jgi:o-succinylbenzoate---CoA ligase
MEDKIEYLRQRTKDNWLVGYDSAELLSLTESLFQELDNSNTQRIIIAESDPIYLLAGLIAASSGSHHIFLGNPAWGLDEWRQVFDLVKPNKVWGDCKYLQKYRINSQSNSQLKKEKQTNSLIMIPTGGSSGKLRFVIHSWQTLMASVEGFQAYFQVNKVNSICVLPLYHVSGLMQFMRSFTSGGRLLVLPFKELKTGKWTSFNSTDFFISLVPTQLQDLLADTTLTNWLSTCKTVLLGGAPSWCTLLEKAKFNQIPLALCYGMTETASQIATLKPQMFLQGNNSSGQVLPHANIRILDEEGKLLNQNQTGRIAIDGTSLALGYYSELFPIKGNFLTDDVGFLDDGGNLHLVGRHSDKVITGGENVYPFEVEEAIRGTNLVADVSVIGIPDNYWGQIITAVYVPSNPNISSQQIQNDLRDRIARFTQPKIWLSIELLPRNAQGKVNRKVIQNLIAKSLHQPENALTLVPLGGIKN